MLMGDDGSSEAVLGECSHGCWCYMQRASVSPSRLTAEGIHLCENRSCLKAAAGWWTTYKLSDLGVWALCEDHSQAVLLHGTLNARVKLLHGECSDAVCRRAAFALGALPHPDVERLHHAPDVSHHQVFDALARTPAPPAGEVSTFCRAFLASGDRPIVVIACGGRNDRADGYPASLWRAGFAVINVDTCNHESHSLLHERVERALVVLCGARVVVCFSSQQPCGAFSVLRFKRVPGQPWKWPILVTRSEPNGKADMWNHPKHQKLLHATWKMLGVVATLFRLVDASGGLCWDENPPSYSQGASYIPGYEEHSSVFETQLFIDLARDTAAELLQHDQCAEAGEKFGTTKRTAVLVNGSHASSCRRFTLFCPHPPGTHTDTVGAGSGAVRGDASNSRKWSAYPRGYVRAWVDCTPRKIGVPAAAAAISMGCSQADGGEYCSGCGVAGVPLHRRHYLDKYYCNNRCSINGFSCIVESLYETVSRAYGMSLGAPSPFEGVPLRCSITGDLDVLQLGAVRVSRTGSALMLRQDVLPLLSGIVDEASWCPFVSNGALSPWLTGTTVGRTLSLSSRQGYVESDEEPSRGAEALFSFGGTIRSKLQYRDPMSYLRTLSSWVRSLQRSEERSSAVVVRCTPRFRMGLDGELRAVLSFPQLQALRISRTGSQLLFECARENKEPWVGRAVVDRLPRAGSKRVVCIVNEHDGMPPAGAPCHCSIASSDVTAERMQYAIRLFCSSELAVGSEVFHTILGWTVDPRHDRVALQLPLTWQAPGLPVPNASQRAAIASAVFKPRGVSIIQGPPGTGKTDTLTALAYFLSQQGSVRILLVAPSNSAADNLVLRIQQTGLLSIRVQAPNHSSAELLPDAVTLLGHSQKFVTHDDSMTLKRLSQLEDKIGELSRSDLRTRKGITEKCEKEAIAAAQVVVTTCATAGEKRIMAHAFNVVIIDEATQATEPETLIPITRGCQQLILIGDHQQLGPVVNDDLVAKAGLALPLFTRLLQGGHPRSMLDVQFRMHPSIASFPSREFYEGKLGNGVTSEERSSPVLFPWATPEPLLFQAVYGVMAKGGHHGTSCYNVAEAEAIAAAVVALLQGGAPAAEVGVVIPYAEQQQLVRKILSDQMPSTDVDQVQLAAVESFQGRERDYICVTFVRSDTNSLGFISDPRRLCVALTRARRGLFMVGNPRTLAQYSPVFERMLLDLSSRGLLVSAVNGEFGRWQPSRVHNDSAVASSAWEERVFREISAAGASESTSSSTTGTRWADASDDDDGELPSSVLFPTGRPPLSALSRLLTTWQQQVGLLLAASPDSAILLQDDRGVQCCALRQLRLPCVCLSLAKGAEGIRQWLESSPSDAPLVRLATWTAEGDGSVSITRRATAVASASVGLTLFGTIEVVEGDADVFRAISALESAQRPYALLYPGTLHTSIQTNTQFFTSCWPVGCAGIGTELDWWVVSSSTSPIALDEVAKLARCDASSLDVSRLTKRQRVLALGVDPSLVDRLSSSKVRLLPPSALVEFVACKLAALRVKQMGLPADEPPSAVYTPAEHRVFIDRRLPTSLAGRATSSAVTSSVAPPQLWPPSRASQLVQDHDALHDFLVEPLGVAADHVAAAAALEQEWEEAEPETHADLATQYLQQREQLFGKQSDAKLGIASGELKPKKGAGSRYRRPCATLEAAMLLVVADGRVLSQSRGDCCLALPSGLFISSNAQDRAFQLARMAWPWIEGSCSGALFSNLLRKTATGADTFRVQFSYPPPGAGGHGRAHSGVAICYDCVVRIVCIETAFDFSESQPTPQPVPVAGLAGFTSHLLRPVGLNGVHVLLPVSADGGFGSGADSTAQPVLDRYIVELPVPDDKLSPSHRYDAGALSTVDPLQLLYNLLGTGREVLEPYVRQALHVALHSSEY